MQPVDYTTLVFVVRELQFVGVPARLEQVLQTDRHTVHLGLRTLKGRQWLTCSWHPQAARLHLSPTVARVPDTFTFSQQIWHQVSKLALVKISLPQAWDRVVDLQFAKRPEDPVEWHLYLEIMGRHSNTVLVNQEGTIVTAAHQVSAQQSRLRPVLTGDRYTFPPSQLLPHPDRQEDFVTWRGRLSIMTRSIDWVLGQRYRGLSKVIIAQLLQRSRIDASTSAQELSCLQWEALFQEWQWWLRCLEENISLPSLSQDGYFLIPDRDFVLSEKNSFAPVNQLLQTYYDRYLGKEVFTQVQQKVSQSLVGNLQRLQQKQQDFEERLLSADRAETIRHQADLLMANLHRLQPGMQEVALEDFTTTKKISIPLDPTQNGAQNAQKLYRRYQKQKRTRDAILPLLEVLHQEISYLHQVDTALLQLEEFDLDSLREIQQELIQQGYLRGQSYERNSKPKNVVNCHRYTSPQGHEIWIGRNNFQNDQITFKVAGDYDLWFHAQEIPGSHVLLRLKPGLPPDRSDLECAANLAAYYSKARHSEQVPVVFTQPKFVYKPRGEKPGMVVYKNEQVIWGKPNCVIVN